MIFSSEHNKITFLIAFLLLTFSQYYNGQTITNKKITYEFHGKLNKSSSEFYLSEVIRVPIKSADPFIAVGFRATLRETSAVELYIRTSFDNIVWSDWQLFDADENSPEAKGIFNSALYFFDKQVKYIQFKTEIPSVINELIFSFINPGETPKEQLSKNLKLSKVGNSQSDERPPFVNRKAWGCPQAENVSSRSLTDVTHLIIHHSAGNTASNDFAAVVRAYWDYHVNSNGWDDIGYNWLVDPNGVLYKGRAWKSATEENVRGAHNSGINGNTSGICLIGNYVSNIPSEEGLDRIADISAFLCTKFEIDPQAETYHAALGKVNDNIDGHGQSGGGTACPGTQVINRLQLIRDMTFEKLWDPAAAPEIIASYPSNLADSAYLSKPVTVQFSHPMDQASVENAFLINPQTSGTFSWNENGNIFSFTPSVPFLSTTVYTVTIQNSAKTIWEIPLVTNYEFSFVTKKYDNLSLVRTYPENGDEGVDLDLTIELIFDGPIDANSLSGKISFVDADSNSVSISVDRTAYSEGIIKFSTISSLAENSEYFIYLKKGISTTDGYSLRNDNTISFTTKSLTSVGDNKIFVQFELGNAYPNPFNPSTNISYSVPADKYGNNLSSLVKLTVFDVLGNEVKTLVNKHQAMGHYQVTFNAGNLSSGIYYYILTVGNMSQTKKMLLLK